MVKNITPIQWLGIILLANATLAGGATQLTTLFGDWWTAKILAASTLGSGFVGGLVTMFGRQGTQIRNVLAMPGVEKVTVNDQANTTLAQAVTDPTLDKIEAIPEAKARVNAIAKGG